MPVVATAGHVDHGKSTLVQALTGRDPDRWDEEKRRGMTIDLGFAWATLPSGRRVSFVDVPGHRRFMGNMLAGVGPVDAALLVVAADEGWMPQSEEHLAVLDLLGVDRAVVAVTKSDRLGRAILLGRIGEISDRLRGTTLEDAQVVPVSAITGDGLDDLRAAIDRTIAPDVEDRGRPRMWVDRSFTIPGAGTVVTGTLIGGALVVGEEVEVWPGLPTVRIRSLQSSEENVDRVGPSMRVAINLAGIDREEVKRGALISRPGSMRPTMRMLVGMRSARYEVEITERGSYLLYVGTSSGKTTLRLLEEAPSGEGRPTLALLEVEQPISVEAGDRFIVRDSGRQMVIGGGSVLDSDPPRRRRDALLLGLDLTPALESGPDVVATVMLNHRRRGSLKDLAARSGGGTPQDAVMAGDAVVSKDEATRLGSAAEAEVASFHEAYRMEKGIGVGQLALALDLDHEMTRAILSGLNELEVSGAVVSARGSQQDEIDSDPRWITAKRVLEAAGMAPPAIKELGLDGELLRVLVRSGRLVRVSDDLVYLPEEAAQMVELVRCMAGPFSVSEFRQRAGISRKHAVPFLEYTDRESVTIRSGDLRTVRH
ncbi:MAG TPA: selenocysteine-specific translation elongation factor [Acidimicrobiia bacterium]|nr:selenocysteine-specific translation elongation factor [Acidimicrobiia bacterium]